MKLCVTLDNKPTRTFLLSKREQKPAFQENFRFQWVTNSAVTSQPCQCGSSSIDSGESQASLRKELGAQGQLGSLLPLWHETDPWRPSAAMEELDIRSSRDHSRDEKKPQHILDPQSHPRQLSHWFHNGREGMSARTGNDWPHFVCIQKQRDLFVPLSWPSYLLFRSSTLSALLQQCSVEGGDGRVLLTVQQLLGLSALTMNAWLPPLSVKRSIFDQGGGQHYCLDRNVNIW